MTAINKTAAVITSEIELKSSNYGGYFLLVEGDFDQRFFEERLDKDLKIINCTGKQPNIEAMAILHSQQKENVLSIIDKDRDIILGKNYSTDRCTYTDESDLEITLLNTVVSNISFCVERLLSQSCDNDKLLFAQTKYGTPVHDKLRKIASEYGFLRLLNEKHHLGINFDELAILNNNYFFIDNNGFNFQKQNLINDFLSKVANNGKYFTHTEIIQEEATHVNEFQSWNLVQGHDYIKLLTSSINSDFLKKNSHHVKATEASLARDLCLTINHFDLLNKKFMEFFKIYYQNLNLKFFK